MKESKENKNNNSNEIGHKKFNNLKAVIKNNDNNMESTTVISQTEQVDCNNVGNNKLKKLTDLHNDPIVRDELMTTSCNNDKKVDKEKTTCSDMDVDSNDGKSEDSSNTSLSSTRPSTRSSSSQRQNHTEPNQSGRSTRLSQNPDFAAKHRKFLNRVHDAIIKSDDQTDESSSNGNSPKSIEKGNSSDESGKFSPRLSRAEKRRRESSSSSKLLNDTDSEQSVDFDSMSTSTDGSPKKKKLAIKVESPISTKPVLEGTDRYCWRCHRDGSIINCKTCPRVYHLRCTQLETVPQSDWVCPECMAIVHAENFDSRSPAMKSLTLDQLCNLLKYTILRMKAYVGSEWFCKPVDQTEFPEYVNFVVRPMDLTLLEKNIKQKRYGSTEAFLADTKWILHNCVVFNTYQSKLSNIAKSLVKICRQEMAEIENCPDCYLNAHTRKDSWFIEVCRRPHLIVWAKLKGFPFWPAKAMRTNNDNHVDVRFFGAHDRAWVPVGSVYLYSRNSPNPSKNKKKNNLDECIMEVEHHIKKLKDRFGRFEYAPFKTPFEPESEDEQLRLLLPGFVATGVNFPSKRYSRSVTSIRKTEGSEHSDKISVKIEMDSKAMNKKQSKDNKNVGNEVKIDSDKPALGTTMTSSTENKDSSDDTGKTDAKSSSQSEPNSISRGLKVKRHSSAIYDGGGGDATDNSKKLQLSVLCEDVIGKSKNNELCAIPSKINRKNSDNLFQIGTDSDKNSDLINNISSSKDCDNNKRNTNSDGTKESLMIAKNLNDNSISNTTSNTSDNDKVSGDISEKQLTEKEANNESQSSKNGDSNEKVRETNEECSDNSKKDNNEKDFISKDQIKREVVSDDEIVEGSSKDVAVDSDKTDKTKRTVDDVESDNNCSNNESIAEITVQVMPEIIDLNDKSTESSSAVVEKICDKEAKSSSNLLDKVMLDSSDESPLLIDESSENEHQKGSTGVSRRNSADSESGSISKNPVDQSGRSSANEDDTGNNLEKSVLLSRRKSKPVKIRSRSNTSSSEDAVEELKRICEEQESFRKVNEVSTIDEVLDEVSGRFRRKDSSNSEDPNVTITLVSDDEPRKQITKVNKDTRPSVSLSRDVSLTVINHTSDERNSNKELPTSLEMECVESDSDESTNNEIRLKPTARKTFSKPIQSSNIKTIKSYSKKDIRITPVEQLTKTVNKIPIPRLPSSSSSSDEIKISNTMSMKLQSGTSNSTTVVNGSRPSSSSPPSSPSNSIAYRNTTTTQARVLPQLQPKPPPSSSASSVIPNDVQLTGPTSVQLDNCSQKLTQKFRALMEEMLHDLSADGSTEATVKTLQLEMERLQWKHRQELAELKHNTDLIIMEMRASLEAEKQRLVMETKMKCEAEKESAINETKMKQWCALCKKEALFYCCWNTAYCNYPCQQAHWPQHMAVCAQTARTSSETTAVAKATSVPSGKNVPGGFIVSNTSKPVPYPTAISSQQNATPSGSKQPTSSNSSVSFIPLSVPNISTCGSSTCTYNRSKPSTVISGSHSPLPPPGTQFYGQGIPIPSGPGNSPLMMSQQSDIKLMPPPSQHQTNVSYSRNINGKLHHSSLPPLPSVSAVPQLNSYRQVSVSVRPPQYFMMPRSSAAPGAFYH